MFEFQTKKTKIFHFFCIFHEFCLILYSKYKLFSKNAKEFSKYQNSNNMKKYLFIIIAAIVMVGCENKTSDKELPFARSWYEYVSDGYYDNFYFGIDNNDHQTHFVWHYETDKEHQEAYWKCANNTITIYRGNETLYIANYNSAKDVVIIGDKVYTRR